MGGNISIGITQVPTKGSTVTVTTSVPTKSNISKEIVQVLTKDVGTEIMSVQMKDNISTQIIQVQKQASLGPHPLYFDSNLTNGPIWHTLKSMPPPSTPPPPPPAQHTDRQTDRQTHYLPSLSSNHTAFWSVLL